MMVLRDLPEDVIDIILCRLPIKDAVRTGILSHSWRRRWESISKLDFTQIPDAVVSQVLRLHSAPIRLFRAKTTDSSTLDVWLSTLSRHSSSTLRILHLSSNFLDPYDALNSHTPLKFHSIARFFPRLTCLRLSYFKLHCIQQDDEEFPGFINLRSLTMYNCRLCGQLSPVISACPALETLNLMDMDSKETQCLSIVSPNLRHLDMFQAIFSVWPSYFSIKSSPLLETARICCFASCSLMKIFGGIPHIKKLSISNFTFATLTYGNIPKRIPICFNHLRSVSLSGDFEEVRQALVTLCLLRSIPHLQELVIEDRPGLGVWSEVIEQGFWEAQEHEGIFDKLETMKMIACTEPMLDFLKIVLAKARELKIVEIRFTSLVSNKELAIAKILDFPIVSNQAQFLFSRGDHEVEYDNENESLIDL